MFMSNDRLLLSRTRSTGRPLTASNSNQR